MAAGILVLVILLAGMAEWVVERLFGTWLKGKWMIIPGSVIGIAIAFSFNLNVIPLLANALPVPDTTAAQIGGTIITGLVIGAGSDATHSFITKFLPRKK